MVLIITKWNAAPCCAGNSRPVVPKVANAAPCCAGNSRPVGPKVILYIKVNVCTTYIVCQCLLSILLVLAKVN